MTNYRKKLRQLVAWLQNYKERTNCKGVVLGISGGKDSTVVAMLAKKVWGNNVLGIMMPNGEQVDLEDSYDIVKTLGINYHVVNIEDIYCSLLQAIPYNQEITDKAKTNIPPRLRMTILYAIAQSIGYQVIGTGNRSEHFIGWFTKWGDGACDLNPIAHLTCSEVIELGKLLAEKFNLPIKYVEKVPSDGLTGKSDEENFGFTYKELDSFIESGIYSVNKETRKNILKKHAQTMHKRRPVPSLAGDE